MIDLYDVLGLCPDAQAEDIKKAFKRKSLECHPDKALNDPKAADRFTKVKEAADCLEDVERRKIYDTFGVDLGEERPEMEVWNIGLTAMLSPLGIFLLKTVVTRFALWIITFKWINRLLMLAGLAVGGLYASDFKTANFHIRSQESQAVLLTVGVVDLVVLLYWIWPLLAETVGVVYLLTEVVGLPLLVQDWKIGIAAALGSFLLAWLTLGRWFWIIVIEVVLGLVTVISLTVASGIMRLWIDQVQTRSDKIKDWRMAMRKERKRLTDENAELKRKLETQKLVSDKSVVEAQRKKIAEDQAFWDAKVKAEQGK